MERAHLVRFERTHDGMQHATIMEQHEVFFLPIMRVHQLPHLISDKIDKSNTRKVDKR